MTNNVLPYLETFPSCASATISAPPPCSQSELDNWERKASNVKLPADLISFYSVCNGLNLKWYAHTAAKCEMDPSLALRRNFTPRHAAENSSTGGSVLVGDGGVNSLSQLKRVRLSGGNPGRQARERAVMMMRGQQQFVVEGGKEDREIDREGEDEEGSVLAFALDKTEGGGMVCLVFDASLKSKNDDGFRVFLKDRACRWHPVADSFTAYFRLVIVHLGIRNWQYVFTEIGLDPIAKALMVKYAPERLVVDLAA